MSSERQKGDESISRGTLKLDGWKPQGPPDPERAKVIRELAWKAVIGIWNTKQKPATLLSIYYHVTDRIAELRTLGLWKYGGWQPGKRFIDRRVNEAADPRFYDDKTPKIVAVTAGLYSPNPAVFESVNGQEQGRLQQPVSPKTQSQHAKTHGSTRICLPEGRQKP